MLAASGLSTIKPYKTAEFTTQKLHLFNGLVPHVVAMLVVARRGQLVEITGVTVATPDRWRKDGADKGPQDVNGLQAAMMPWPQWPQKIATS